MSEDGVAHKRAGHAAAMARRRSGGVGQVEEAVAQRPQEGRLGML
jgi:hypothetical protein